MRKIKKTSVVFFALVMAMVANVAIAKASYDFTIYRGVVDQTDTYSTKDADSKYGIVSVLASSAPGYTTDYLFINTASGQVDSSTTRVSNARGSYGQIHYKADIENKSLNERLRGADNRLMGPSSYTVSGLWSAKDHLY